MIFKEIPGDEIFCLVRTNILNEIGSKKLLMFVIENAHPRFGLEVTQWDMLQTQYQVAKRINETGGLTYELRAFETRSKRPETITFEHSDFKYQKDKIDNFFESYDDFMKWLGK